MKIHLVIAIGVECEYQNLLSLQYRLISVNPCQPSRPQSYHSQRPPLPLRNTTSFSHNSRLMQNNHLEALCIFKLYSSSILLVTRSCHVHRRPVLMCDIWLLLLLCPLDLVHCLRISVDLPSLSLTITMIANLLSLHLGLKVSLMQFFSLALEHTSVVHQVLHHIMSDSQVLHLLYSPNLTFCEILAALCPKSRLKDPNITNSR
jgi:hypothetical protein